MKQIWHNHKACKYTPHLKSMKDIWQHTSGTMYIRWIKIGVDGGEVQFLMRRIVCFGSRNLSTITRDWNWPLPLVSSKIFLKLNIKMYTFYCQLYLLPKPEVMGAMANFFQNTKVCLLWKKTNTEIAKEQSNVSVWYK